MQQSADNGLNDDLQSIFLGGWQLEIANGGSAGWGRTEANREGQPGPDICWEKDGTVEPLGLLEMDDEEREVSSIAPCGTTNPCVVALLMTELLI